MSTTDNSPLYKKEDNVYQRFARFMPDMNIAFDETFKGLSKNGKQIEWDYLSIHEIRRWVNKRAWKYGLVLTCKAQAPLPNMLPEEVVEVKGNLVARAWQNAILVNIDNPKDTMESEPTSGEAMYTDDKAVSRAKQQAAKTAIVDVLNIAAGEDADRNVGEVNPPKDATNAGDDKLYCKLQPKQIERFRELLAQAGLEEAKELATVTDGRQNKLDAPLTPQSIRKLMERLNVEADRITDFLSKLIGSKDEPTVPAARIAQGAARNAAAAFRRKLNELPQNAQKTFLASICMNPEALANLGDETAYSLIPQIDKFARSIQPASRRALAGRT